MTGELCWKGFACVDVVVGDEEMFFMFLSTMSSSSLDAEKAMEKGTLKI